MLDIATLLNFRQEEFPSAGGSPPAALARNTAPCWPDRLIFGVHSLEASANIVPNLPESRALGLDIFEKKLLRQYGARRCPARDGGRLVSNSILDRNLPSYLLLPQETATYYRVYHQDTYLCRNPPTMPPVEPNVSTRGTIYELSAKSRSRLKHVCDNSGHRIKSQFCLTYHDQNPTDGQEVKKHLASFKKALRRQFPGVGYIWVLEFQKRGVPHYHLFLTIPPDPEKQGKLARSWVKITNGTQAQQEWHGRSQNWIPWDMGINGNYVVDQYLTKQVQKDVPHHYQSVGRFWGVSRNLIPIPEIITAEQIAERCETSITWDANMINHFIARTFRRLQENQMNRDRSGKARAGKKRKASFLRQQSELGGCFKVRHGSRVLMQIINYVRFNAPDIHTMQHKGDEIPF
jgi:hypothetical protein